MKLTRLIALILVLALPFSSFSQDLLAYAGSVSSSIKTTITTKESIKEQEHRLTSNLNKFLASSIKYPSEARENGEEGMVRGVIIISPDHSKTSLKIAKGTSESLKTALIEAYNKVKIIKFVSDNYKGRKAIPIKINFELER